MGRNQMIAAIVYGLTWLTSIVIVMGLDAERASAWLNYSLVLAPVAVSTILVPSAMIKVLAKGNSATIGKAETE